MDTKEKSNNNSVLIPLRSIASDEQISQLRDIIEASEYKNYTIDQVVKQIYDSESFSKDFTTNISSPKENFSFLSEKMEPIKNELESQTEKLEKANYENMKLNA